METRGLLSPDTAAEARERYAELGPTAQVVVKEVATAMDFEADEYHDRVDATVIETARDALFASLLTVHVGSREAYEDWLAERDVEATEMGSENVERVVWHHVQFADAVAAATFHEAEQAAVSTLRRQAFGRHYRDVVSSDADGTSESTDGATDE